MTDLSTGNLERLLAEVSPGPWEARSNYQDGHTRPDTSYQMCDAAGDYIGIMHGQDAHITALAPDLDKEILRLRAGVEEILNMCLLERDSAFQDSPMRAGEVTAFNLCAERLADLLEAYNLGDQNYDHAEPLPVTNYDHRLNRDN